MAQWNSELWAGNNPTALNGLVGGAGMIVGSVFSPFASWWCPE